jgi:hypothetical protein
MAFAFSSSSQSSSFSSMTGSELSRTVSIPFTHQKQAMNRKLPNTRKLNAFLYICIRPFPNKEP